VNLHLHWYENLKSYKGDILPVHAMEAETEVQKVLLYALLIIALDGFEQSGSCPGLFNPRETACDMHVIGGWLRVGQHLEEESPVPSRKWMMIPQSCRMQPSHYSNYISMYFKLIEHQHFGTVICGRQCCNNKKSCTA
jgi:hypothetical protein